MYFSLLIHKKIPTYASIWGIKCIFSSFFFTFALNNALRYSFPYQEVSGLAYLRDVARIILPCLKTAFQFHDMLVSHLV